MKTNLILTGTDNDGFRHRYSIQKDEKFKEEFVKFMEKLGFNPEEMKRMFIGTRNIHEKDGESDNEEIELDINQFEDCCRHYKNKSYDIDIFFGNKKIILVVRTKSRIPMVDYLEKEAGWVKLKEIINIQKKNKNKVRIPLAKSRV